MKRAVRWIGIGITAAAAATMLLADLALADSPTEMPPYVTVRFDLASPAGAVCRAEGARDVVRDGADIFGRPYLRNLAPGDAVTCIAADGRSFALNTLRDPRDPLALTVEVIVADRAGKALPLVMVQADTQDMPLPVRGNATALAPVVR